MNIIWKLCFPVYSKEDLFYSTNPCWPLNGLLFYCTGGCTFEIWIWTSRRLIFSFLHSAIRASFLQSVSRHSHSFDLKYLNNLCTTSCQWTLEISGNSVWFETIHFVQKSPKESHFRGLEKNKKSEYNSRRLNIDS